MSPDPEEMERIQAAKEALREEYGDRDWFRGCGIGPAPEGLALRLNVDPAAKVPPGEIPTTYRGFPVEVVYIDTYKPRGN